MKKSLIVTLCMVLLIPLISMGIVFSAPSVYDNTFMHAWNEKMERLGNTSGKRIVIIGGSSAVFGIDSSLVEENLEDYTVVNCGMYAGMGIEVLLEQCLPYLTEDDLVIIMCEPQIQMFSDYFEPKLFLGAVDGNDNLLIHTTAEQKKLIAGNLIPFGMEKLKTLISGSGDDDLGIYQSSSFNAYGDIDNETMEEYASHNIMAGGYDPTMMVELERLPDESFLSVMKNFRRRCAGTVLYHTSPVNALCISGSLNDFYIQLREETETGILGEPEDSVLEAGWFYDTNFHLNASGRILFTKLLIQELKAYMGDSSLTVIDVPDLPDSEEITIYSDDSDQDCFTYEEQNGLLWISGLTEIGIQKESIIVPTKAQGIMENALKDVNVRELIVPAQSFAFMDGCFAGCDLTLVLEGEDPSLYRCGNDLMRDCTLRILVMSDARERYRLDYTWSRYASYIDG